MCRSTADGGRRCPTSRGGHATVTPIRPPDTTADKLSALAAFGAQFQADTDQLAREDAARENALTHQALTGSSDVVMVRSGGHTVPMHDPR